MAGIQGVEEVKEKGSKGCRNPRSGEPGGSRNPRGQVLKSGRNSKGGALPAARASYFPSRLCPSARDFALPRASFAILRQASSFRADFVFLRAS